MPSSLTLRRDAESIWRAGVAAVDSERLVAQSVRRTETELVVCGHAVALDRLGRIAVVGAGKAGGGMAAAFEHAVGPDLLQSKVFGWVNVPADCVRPLEKIRLHAARPAGHNEPTEAGVAGATQILKTVAALEPEDVCVVLLSGGGSALLPAPAAGVSLADKQAVTRLLMQSGATIGELNCVRKQLSRIKGGGLARACRAGTMLTLIISDVIGDRLDVIASGPTVADTSTPAEALAVLQKYASSEADVPHAVWNVLTARAAEASELRRAGGVSPPGPGHDPVEDSGGSRPPLAVTSTVHNHVIGNNAIALEAAAARAGELGYRVHSLGSDNAGEARDVGQELAELCLSVRDTGRPVVPPACILSGGEPVVHLIETDQPRKGGRNQELVLAALERLWDDGLDRIVLLSGGTDGEDGPTDAAGAVADAGVQQSGRQQGLVPGEFLSINNSYPFFDRTGGLLKTGPTQTNVMDLRVALVAGDAY